MLLDGLPDERVLLLDATDGTASTVGDVRREAAALRAGPRRLTFLAAATTAASARWLLALLEAEQPVVLVDPALDDAGLRRLAALYEPDRVVDLSGRHVALLAQDAGLGVTGDDGGRWERDEPAGGLHPELAILLTTSGTTGSPKLVRLSRTNVRANAQQIAESLRLREPDRGVTLMPLHYSFGMSVLTSHAVVGSPVVVTAASVLEEELWKTVAEHRVTLLPAVPTTVAMLRRLGFERRALPALRALIQAGGRLAPELVDWADAAVRRGGGRLYVMYGQTEASPRMAVLPPERLADKPGSVGLPLPGGEFAVLDAEGRRLPPGEVGEVVYRGPNVMMGYAESRADLGAGCEVQELRTGDLGLLDAEGFLFLRGRSKRISKLAGVRVSLDEVEELAQQLAGGAGCAALDAGDAGLAVCVSGVEQDLADRLRRDLARRLRVPPALVRVRVLDRIPLLASGKTDYRALAGPTEEAAP